MRISNIAGLGAAILTMALIVGCSKSSTGQSQNTVLPNLTDLGKVELVPGVPTPFSLSGGKACTLTGKQVPDGIEVDLLISETNADGSIKHSIGKIRSRPGMECTISFADISVGITPTLKMQ